MSKTFKSSIPPTLKKGDAIAIIATARYVDLKILEFAEQLFDRWGLKVIRGENVLKKQFNFAGSDHQRVTDLQWAMDDPKIKAIFCFRGGYGSTRILERVNPKAFIKNPKWLVGFSDVTALHNYIGSICNTASVHATMPINYKENTDQALLSLKQLLFDKKMKYSLEPCTANVLGEASGPIVGGNLAILQSLSGTKYDIDTKGKILFLEDVDEYLYNIDRMLWTLKHAGKLAHISGLIVGGFTKIKDNDDPFGMNVQEIVLEKVKQYNYPVCFNFPAGHFDDNRTIAFGLKTKLSVSNYSVIVSH